jgi:hypothetical protein
MFESISYLFFWQTMSIPFYKGARPFNKPKESNAME